MDFNKVKIYLQTLIYITLPYYIQSQGGAGIRCPIFILNFLFLFRSACEIGFTCAMVRHGNGLPSPGCISMQEAILLNQALQGGPSGPGTGISHQGQQQTPQTGASIPGVNFFGGGPPPERPGFEDRFRSFQNPSSFTPPGVGFPQQGAGFPPQGTGFPQQGIPGFPPQGAPGFPSQGGPGFPEPGGGWGQQTGGMPGQFNQGMNVPQGFIDPVSGAPVNPGFGNGGFGGGGRIDGGQTSPTSHAGSAGRGQMGSFNSVTNQGNAFSSSGGSFSGANLSPNIGPASIETIGQGEGRVSTIMEDTGGYYYIFYPMPSSPGYRVNITKDGLCTRYETTQESLPCVTACTSDDQCPRNFKCCPTRCSLGCMPPYEERPAPQQPQPQALSRVPNQGISGTMGSMGRIGGNCRPCDQNNECLSDRPYCYYSSACARRVCQGLKR